MQLWPILPHTAAKHVILRRYLGAWLPIMGRYHNELLFVDGFAGPGEYSGGEPGSPVVALDVISGHIRDLSSCTIHVVLIERDDETRNHLEQVLSRKSYPANVRIQVLDETFAQRFARLLDNLESLRRPTPPSLVMVDPFGFSGVPMELLRRLGTHPRTELLVSLMTESINRFLDKPELRPTFDGLFGSAAWADVHALPPGEPRWQAIYAMYADALEKAGFARVRAFEMRDAGDRVEYHLTFATKSDDGLKQMKMAMWKADPWGSFRFSDATNPNQLTLFQPEPDFAQLAKMLYEAHRGLTRAVPYLENYVTVSTPFLDSHLRRALRILEESGEVTVLMNRKRQAGSYPKDSSIRFHDGSPGI